MHSCILPFTFIINVVREKKVELAEKQRERSMYGLPLPPEDTNGSIGKQKEKKQKSGKTAESVRFTILTYNLTLSVKSLPHILTMLAYKIRNC